AGPPGADCGRAGVMPNPGGKGPICDPGAADGACSGGCGGGAGGWGGAGETATVTTGSPESPGKKASHAIQSSSAESTIEAVTVSAFIYPVPPRNTAPTTEPQPPSEGRECSVPLSLVGLGLLLCIGIDRFVAAQQVESVLKLSVLGLFRGNIGGAARLLRVLAA